MSRHYDDRGSVLDGEYQIQAHLADDGELFCSLVDTRGVMIFPSNIEYIERELFDEEAASEGVQFDEILLPEANRLDSPPVIGLAVYRKGILERLEFDLSMLLSDV